MALSLMNIVTAAGALGSAVVGGVYTNFSLRIMPRLARLPEVEGITTMQQFNRVALQAPFLTAFFGTAIVSIAKVVTTLAKQDRTTGDLTAMAGGGLYLAGFVLTIVYNVPRNEQLAAITAGTAEGTQVWRMYLTEWTPANSVRGVLSILGALGLGIGALLSISAAD
ncbi:MAG: DUF1772 domain-containing protein [Propionibacteriaceae bacterium]|nr:DUF1772 domain-containing protein [Propionibacteriaceae bacterium]